MGHKLTYITADCRLAAKNGDENAMDTIINHYMPYIKALAKKTAIKCCGTANAELEKDFTQELITELINGSRRFKEIKS